MAHLCHLAHSPSSPERLGAVGTMRAAARGMFKPLPCCLPVLVLLGSIAACDGESSGTGDGGSGGKGGLAGRTGGTAGTGGLSASGGTSSGGGPTYTCEGPSCCVAINLRPENIWVDGAGSSLSIKMVVERAGGDDNYWVVSADVAVPGGQATCTSTTESPNANFVFLTCPLIALEPMPACDSMLALQFRLRTSTFAGYGDAGLANPVCSPSASTDIELQQRVICPTCPASLSPYPAPVCEIPQQRCPNTSGSPGSDQLPCTCTMSSWSGERKWSCPVPNLP
jgi:hypothetical protein